MQACESSTTFAWKQDKNRIVVDSKLSSLSKRIRVMSDEEKMVGLLGSCVHHSQLPTWQNYDKNYVFVCDLLSKVSLEDSMWVSANIYLETR